MKFRCRKVRDSVAVYSNPDGTTNSKRGFSVFLMPAESQHEQAGGIIEIQMTLWNSSPYQEGHEYELNLQDVEEYVQEVHTRKAPLPSA